MFDLILQPFLRLFDTKQQTWGLEYWFFLKCEGQGAWHKLGSETPMKIIDFNDPRGD